MLRTILKNRVVANAGWLIAGKVAQMLISFVVGLLTARYLGPSNYGLINYAGAYTAFFASVCTLGINSVLVKELLDHPQQEGELLGTSLLLRAVSSVLSALMMIGISAVADADEPTTFLVVVLTSLVLLFQIFDTFQYWFQAKLKSKVTAVASLVAYSCTAAYKIFLLATGKSVVWFALATSLDYFCYGALLLLGYWSLHGMRLCASKACAKRLLKSSHHFILPGLMVAIYGYTDKIMLKLMLTETETGYYSTAVALCSIWNFVLAAVIDSVFPTIMEAHGKDDALYLRRNRQLYAFVFYLSAAVSVVFTLLGEPIIGLLYGQQYLPAAAPLRVITWYTAFSYLGAARNAWVVCEKKQSSLKYRYAASALLNVVMNFLLIPGLGATGAAIASLATQVSSVFLFPLLFRPYRQNTKLMLQAIALRGVFPGRRKTKESE